MRFDQFSFDAIRIDGSTCEYDVVIDRGENPQTKKRTVEAVHDRWEKSGVQVGSDGKPLDHEE